MPRVLRRPGPSALTRHDDPLLSPRVAARRGRSASSSREDEARRRARATRIGAGAPRDSRIEIVRCPSPAGARRRRPSCEFSKCLAKFVRPRRRVKTWPCRLAPPQMETIGGAISMQKEKSYPGPERRVHRMYVTRNTEYHFRGEVCVAVRDRKTGRWLDSHLAVNRRLTGGVRFSPKRCRDPLSGATSARRGPLLRG